MRIAKRMGALRNFRNDHRADQTNGRHHLPSPPLPIIAELEGDLSVLPMCDSKEKPRWIGTASKEIGSRSKVKSRNSGASSLMMISTALAANAISSRA